MNLVAGGMGSVSPELFGIYPLERKALDPPVLFFIVGIAECWQLRKHTA